MTTPPSPSPKAPLGDDEDLDLPPLDADDGGEVPALDELDGLLDGADDEAANAGDPFDDRGSDLLDIGEELDMVLDDGAMHAGGQLATPDEPEVDIGSSHEGFSDEAISHDDSVGLPTEPDHDGVDHAALDDAEPDGGEEGTSERIEDEVDPDLFPDMDADDEGDLSDDELISSFQTETDDATLPQWSDEPWRSPAGSGAEVPCRDVRARAGRVVAAGDAVLLVEVGAHAARRARLEGGAHSVDLFGPVGFVAATSRGVVLSDAEAGEEPTVIWRSDSAAVEVVFAASQLWALADGALWRVALPPSNPTMVRDGHVLAVAGSDAALLVLVQDPSSQELGIDRLRRDDEGFERIVLTGEAADIAAAAPARMATSASGQSVALVGGGRLAVSRDGGASFELPRLPPIVAAAFLGDARDASIVAVAKAPDAWVLLELPARGPSARLADLGAAVEADDPELSLAFDETRELVWVAGPWGLSALGPAREH